MIVFSNVYICWISVFFICCFSQFMPFESTFFIKPLFGNNICVSKSSPLDYFSFKDLRAALLKIFSIISTAWFIPSWDFGNSYFIKCKTSSWDSVDINALEKGYEDSLSQMYWIGNFFSDRKSIFAPFLKLRFVFCIEPSCNNLTMIWDT